MQLALYGEEAGGEAVLLGAISARDRMESTVTEEKIEIEQIEEFTDELSDEALDRVKEREESTCWVPCVNLSNA